MDIAWRELDYPRVGKEAELQEVCVCESQVKQCIFSTSDQIGMRESSFQPTFRWGILQRVFLPNARENNLRVNW